MSEKLSYEIEISEKLIEYIKARPEIDWSKVCEAAINRQIAEICSRQLSSVKKIRSEYEYEVMKKELEKTKQTQKRSENLCKALYEEALETGDIGKKLPKLDRSQIIALARGLLEHADNNANAVSFAIVNVMEGYRVVLTSNFRFEEKPGGIQILSDKLSTGYLILDDRDPSLRPLLQKIGNGHTN